MLEITAETVYFQKYKDLESSEWNDRLLRKTIKTSEDPTIIENLKDIRRRLLAKSNTKPGLRKNRILSKFVNDDQSKIIASMLPDEVLTQSDYEPRMFEGCMFFADISGFTEISEKYQSIPNGASKMSQVVNFYISTMVQEILSHGGDVIKYSGDAYIAVFKVTSEQSFQEVVNNTLDTAILIQKNCRNYRTEVGVFFNVKIAIAVGQVYFSAIGNENSSHYVLVGEPLWKVKSLEKVTNPGEILITQQTWNYAQQDLYTQEYQPDRRCHKLKNFKDTFGGMQRQYEAIFTFLEMQKIFSSPSESSLRSNSMMILESSNDPFSVDPETKRDSKYGLRKSLHIQMDDEMKTYLRSFMIPPLLKAIDADEPLELLTEMRHIVIVFCNFAIPQVDSLKIIEIVNSIYIPLCEIVASHEGIVNKVSLFDKDMMFLVIFGLRGFRHDVESQMGLRCAAELHQKFKSMEGLLEASIGVTTGKCYCGVVGHSLRREYSVLSVTVNKAARLMVNYPNIVSCDRETFLRSKMDYKHFTLMPKIKMKGLKDDVSVYKFEEIFEEQFSELPVVHQNKILGQDKVINLCQSFIDDSLVNFLRDIGLWKVGSKDDSFVSCFIIKGDSQQGKTRLLDEIFLKNFKSRLNCVKVTLHPNQYANPFSTIRSTLYQVMRIPIDLSSEERQELLTNYLDGWNMDHYFWFLNSIFNVNFPDTGDFSSMNPADQQLVRKSVFKILCFKVFEHFWIVLIDDMEFADNDSMEMFDFLFELRNVFVIFTIGRRRKPSEEKIRLMKSSYVKRYRLEQIEPNYLKILACQYLKVAGFSRELEKFLYTKSNGNPGWIKTFLSTLTESSKLEIRQVSEKEALELQLSFADKDNLDETSNAVAILKGKISEDDFITDLTVESNMLLYDTLTSFEQLICKCTSLLGDTFSRQMLNYVLLNNERSIAEAIVHLFEQKILMCATERDFSDRRCTNEEISCYCKIFNIPQMCRDLPKYSCCNHTKFTNKNFQKTIYDLLTENQRIEYHKRSLMYLYHKTRRCESCDGGFFEKLVYNNKGFEFNAVKTVRFDDRPAREISLKEPVVYKEFKKYRYSKEHPMIPQKLDQIQEWFCVLGLMKNELGKCECNQILYNVYKLSIRHCEGANFTLKAIEAKMELASICIKLEKFEEANQLSEDVLDMIKSEDRQIDRSGFLTYLHGRAYTFLGLCLAKNGENSKAMNCFYKTCQLYGIHFPKVHTFWQTIRMWISKKHIRATINNPIVDDSALNIFFLVTNQLTECFNSMFEILLERREYDLALFTAYWSLEKALKYKQRQLPSICISFTNLMRVLYCKEMSSELSWLAKISMKLLVKSASRDEIDDYAVKVILDFFLATVYARISSAEWPEAIDMGNIAIKVCNRIQFYEFQIKIVPTMTLLMINQIRIRDVLYLLQDFHSELVTSTEDRNAHCWYYALAIDVLLDTGFPMVSFEEVKLFCLNQLEDPDDDTPIDKISFSRLYVNMWLWCLRHGIGAESKRWLDKFERFFSFERQDTTNNILTSIRFLEGMNLLLISAIMLKDEESVKFLSQDIQQVCEILKRRVAFCRIHEERFQLHKLHYEQILKPSENNINKLENLEKAASKRKQYFLSRVIEHTYWAWKGTLPKYLEHIWQNRSGSQFRIDEMITDGDVIYPFTLPCGGPSKDIH